MLSMHDSYYADYIYAKEKQNSANEFQRVVWLRRGHAGAVPADGGLSSIIFSLLLSGTAGNMF